MVIKYYIKYFGNYLIGLVWVFYVTHMETSPLPVKDFRFWLMLDHWAVRPLERATPVTKLLEVKPSLQFVLTTELYRVWGSNLRRCLQFNEVLVSLYDVFFFGAFRPTWELFTHIETSPCLVIFPHHLILDTYAFKDSPT